MMGAIAMASAVVALFFLRFWRQTGDRLFAIFAAAFGLLGLTRLALALLEETVEAHRYVYLLRLCAFLLIIVAIMDKNRAGRRGAPARPGS